MSKLSEYSKFDHLDTDDEDECDVEEQQREQHRRQQQQKLIRQQQQQQLPPKMVSHPRRPNRYVYEYNGRAVYEWEQSLSETIIYIPLPPQMTGMSAWSSKSIEVTISPSRLVIRQRRQGQSSSSSSPTPPAYIDESTRYLVDVDESTWSIEDDDDDGDRGDKARRRAVVVYLQKAQKGLVWESPLMGVDESQQQLQHSPSLDPHQMEKERSRLMLERWQEENPGMDFRDATFNGSVPDPRTFMGGVSYE